MFEYLPLAARIGGRILALHGGVGRTLDSIDQINALKRPLCIDHGINDEQSHGTQDPPDGTVSPVLGSGALDRAQADPLQHLLMDILWSDPSANDDVLGVAKNLQRGGATLTYGPDRVRRFCSRNQVDLLIRAHECVGDGYQVRSYSITVTLSSSNCKIGVIPLVALKVVCRWTLCDSILCSKLLWCARDLLFLQFLLVLRLQFAAYRDGLYMNT